MALSSEQLTHFQDEGYLFLPEVFSLEEMAFLKAEAQKVFQQERPEIRREKTGAPRTAFGVHRYNEAFGLLARDPRLIEPLEAIFGERSYMHQFKINAMSAFMGDVWWWHQDFPTWHKEDGMPAPRAMNVALFLDEVRPVNGPLMLVPRSHREGMFEPRYDAELVSHHGLYMTQENVCKVVDAGGIVAPTGKPGGLLMFHANMVHGSSPNISPYSRNIVYLTLNPVSNALAAGQQSRPDHIAHRDFAPIVPGARDALLRHVREHQAADAVAG